MRVLDLDLDYFLDAPVYDIDYSIDTRVEDYKCVKSVWKEDRVRNFLEKNLNLSKNNKIEGRIIKQHDEALFFWEELIEMQKLTCPFSVVHVDSHADLSYGDITKNFVLNYLISWNPEKRITRYCKDCEVDGRFYNIGIGNFLLYAIAFRWISDLTYCANSNGDVGDIPEEILTGSIPEFLSMEYKTYIKLKPTDEACESADIEEPKVPLRIVPRVECVHNIEKFNFLSIAKSPNYTPKEADYILEVVKEYIIEI